MHTEIDVKLRDDAIPYVALIRRVTHALQEPLRLELEKLIDEGILHKFKIDEKSEWLNSFFVLGSQMVPFIYALIQHTSTNT